MNYAPFRCFFAVIAIYFSGAYLSAFASTQQIIPTSIAKKMAKLEASFDGRIGIFAINTANNQQLQYRADEPFPLQSTFKLMAVSAILKKSMTDKHLLQQKLTYTKQDLVFWSPITEKHLNEGMTIADLCSAAMSYSDNTATSLLVKQLGGPEAVTAFAHSIGDKAFRIDSWEPDLNSNPSDLRDTTTAFAMAKSLQKLTLGNILAPPRQEQLVAWMKANTTGDARIRAALPKGWIVADKTGASNDFGVSNDIGIIWPQSCAPIVVAIYSIHNRKDRARRDDLIASATRILMNEFSRTDQCLKLKSSQLSAL